MSGGWGSDKSVFLTNEVNCFRSWISSFHFFLFFLFVFRLRWHPDVYHFLPIIYELSVWTINCDSRTAPTDLHTRWKNLQDPSWFVCLRGRYRYFCHHYCSAGSHQSGAGGPTLFTHLSRAAAQACLNQCMGTSTASTWSHPEDVMQFVHT